MNREELRGLFLNKTPLIDVRAPVEFTRGHVPGAVNLPILNDEERALIGTTYKERGSEAAVQLGHQLISGEIKNERVRKWLGFIKKHPNAVIYCFRGGLRSQIARQWILEAGADRPLIPGGYKRVRHFLMEETLSFPECSELLVISGKTGSGKTDFLHEVEIFYPVLDLEGLACHRGSAFGATALAQPTQTNFENYLAVSLLRHSGGEKPLLVEDESHLIGSRAVPKAFFDQMRASPVIWMEESLENRVANIFRDYIAEPARNRSSPEVLRMLGAYKDAVRKISRKLGGLRTSELLSLLVKAENEFLSSADLTPNREWIEKLLVYYYDAMYVNSLTRRNVKLVFKGSRQECRAYLSK